MSFKQENDNIEMKHDEEEKKVSDLATELEEDQVAHILNELSNFYGYLEDAEHTISDLKVHKAAKDFGAGHPGMRVVETIGEMEEAITKTLEATSVLYDHVAGEDQKLKQKTEKFVRTFDSLGATDMQKKEILKRLIDKL